MSFQGSFIACKCETLLINYDLGLMILPVIKNMIYNMGICASVIHFVQSEEKKIGKIPTRQLRVSFGALRDN